MSGIEANNNQNTVTDLGVVDTTSTGESQSSVSGNSARQEIVVTDGTPRFTHIATMQQASFDMFVAHHVLQNEVPGIRDLRIMPLLRDVAMDDTAAAQKGWIMLGCGSGKYNPEDGLIVEQAVKTAQELGANGKKYARLCEDIRISQAGGNLPPTMLQSIIEVMPEWVSDNTSVRCWLWPALDAIRDFEAGPQIDFRDDEPNVVAFYRAWREVWEEHYPPEIMEAMEKQMDESRKTWMRNPTELAAVTHAMLTVNGLSLDSKKAVMDWLTTAFVAMANAQTGHLKEVERLKSLKPIEIVAGRLVRDRSKSEQTGTEAKRVSIWKREVNEKKLKLLIVTNATRHTAYTARSIGNDMVVAMHADGGFGISLKRETTRGFNLRSAARMVRCIVLCRRGRAKEAFRMWRDLDCAGEHPEVPGVIFNPVTKIVRNGAAGRQQIRHDLPISRFDLERIAQACLHEQKVVGWLMWAKREFDPLPRRSSHLPNPVL